ncbi:hypothetical protein PFISCL1PPCAC_19448, partial [Pristionchus fissidentatus]
DSISRMLRASSLLLLCVLTAQCAVHFKRSMLIDQYDLDGVTEFKAMKVCDYGCHVWASIPPGTEDSAKNIHIDDEFFFNLAETATMYDHATLEKQPMFIDSNDAVSIYNFNPNQTTTPFIIYIVSTRATDLNTAEIYDAHNINRMIFPAKQITIMSAAPFTVNSNKAEGGNSVVVRTTGFDDVEDNNKDKCFQMMAVGDKSNWPGFNIEVSSPLLSMAFDYKNYPDAYLHLDVTMGNSGVLDLTRPGFVSSPGYIGCSNGDVFRSSLYSSNVATSITASGNRHVYLNGDIHTDRAHQIDIIDLKTNMNYPMYGGSAAQSQELFTTGVSINWKGEGTNNSFAIRFSSVAV